ncbi:hypothetical protein TB2_026723 [Malus domestica]
MSCSTASPTPRIPQLNEMSLAATAQPTKTGWSYSSSGSHSNCGGLLLGRSVCCLFGGSPPGRVATLVATFAMDSFQLRGPTTPTTALALLWGSR